MKPIFDLSIDLREKPYETVLDEAMAAQEKEWLALAIDPKKKRKHLSSIELKYPLPDAYQIDFTKLYSTKSREHVYAFVWEIHTQQFYIIKELLTILASKGLVVMNEYDFAVEADGFDLTKLTLGDLLIQDSLYSFDLTFTSKKVGTVKARLIVTDNGTIGDVSISYLDIEKLPMVKKIEDPVQEEGEKYEHKHRRKKN